MTSRPSSKPSPRLPPGLIQAATAHAHALRNQAIADAIGEFAIWLRRRLNRRNQLTVREKPCLS